MSTKLDLSEEDLVSWKNAILNILKQFYNTNSSCKTIIMYYIIIQLYEYSVAFTAVKFDTVFKLKTLKENTPTELQKTVMFLYKCRNTLVHNPTASSRYADLKFLFNSDLYSFIQYIFAEQAKEFEDFILLCKLNVK